jgi:hypothetical protein
MERQFRVDGQTSLYFDDVEDIEAAALRFRHLGRETDGVFVSGISGDGDQSRPDRDAVRLFQSQHWTTRTWFNVKESYPQVLEIGI